VKNGRRTIFSSKCYNLSFHGLTKTNLTIG